MRRESDQHYSNNTNETSGNFTTSQPHTTGNKLFPCDENLSFC